MNGSWSQSVSETLRASQLADTLVNYADVLKARRKGIDALNVYPVPDGDTGTNMSLTVASVVKELKQAARDDMGSISAAISRGAIMGARGNSGAILAQALRGVAESVRDKKALTPADVADAFERARSGAYESVLKPVEGTILTVLTAAATAARKSADEGAKLKEQLDHVRLASAEALARTPDLLPQLKAAGVVDAGGSGFLLFVDALRFVATGEPIPAAELSGFVINGDADDDHLELEVEKAHGEGDDIGELRYEVMFLLEDVDDKKINEFRAKWGDVGDSIVVVGGGGLLNCHIHADDIGPTIEVALDYGRPRNIRVTDLLEQVDDLHTHGVSDDADNFDDANADANVEGAICSAVVVTSGKGLVSLFKSLGAAKIVAGGQSMNPSVEELLTAVNSCKTDDVVIFTNNKNVIAAAQQVNALSEKNVAVVPTKTSVEGLSAMVAFSPTHTSEQNVSAISDAITGVVSCEITQAVRDADTEAGKVKQGDWLAVGTSGIEATGDDPIAVATKWLEKNATEDHEIVTMCLGVGAQDECTSAIGAWINDNLDGVEVQVHQGNQPLHAYLLGLE